jgi:uncharacterized protein (UPF0147 family)
MDEGKYQEIIEHLEMIKEDQDTNKKVQEIINKVITLLKNNKELSCQKAVLELEEINSQNVKGYLQTELWDVMSKLECINSQ